MSDPVIRIENLGKKYLIDRQQQQQYSTLRDAIVGGVQNLFKPLVDRQFKLDRTAKREEFWALKDLSLEIKQGDRVGIIGRNGAGKSTLLKILSRITDPTCGSIRIKGKVASLLEVGTGFHPELTGRENIFLNGAILGMSKTDIAHKFDEIVDFAEVEKFLDTPVKRYSSGMYVRLAFAVAAHLEPEILIVDEVLAVGDIQFQKKCLGKMEDVGRQGRTVIFVSHNMSAIQALCSRCILLSSGMSIADDTPAAAVKLYLEDASASNNFSRPIQKSGKPSIISGELISHPEFEDSKIQINLNVQTNAEYKVSLELRLSDRIGTPIGFGNFGIYRANEAIDLKTGLNFISFNLSIDRLAVGTYFVSLDLAVPWVEFHDRIENCLLFEVTRYPKDGADCVMSQAWCYGSLEIPLELNSHQINELSK
jgi:lipopolysaccharide transport system ATP-binding protein